MSLTIDLPEEVEAALASQARAVSLPTERYLAQLIEQALERQRLRSTEALTKTLDQMACPNSLLATAEEMEAALEAALAEVRPQRSWRS